MSPITVRLWPRRPARRDGASYVLPIVLLLPPLLLLMVSSGCGNKQGPKPGAGYVEPPSNPGGGGKMGGGSGKKAME
jgi:hypothetical protein